MLNEFRELLKDALAKDLPAHKAHQKVMAHRRAVNEPNYVPKTARASAVLILLYPKKTLLHTVFILRPTYRGVHSGQIAFPGGKAEPQDRSMQDTALREAQEELNIQGNDLEIIGELTPLYVPPSNFLIYPYIALQEQQPQFIAEEREVEAILECPLEALLGQDKLVKGRVQANGNSLLVQGFYLKERLIWGATGMIVKELTEVLEQLKVPSELLYSRGGTGK